MIENQLWSWGLTSLAGPAVSGAFRQVGQMCVPCDMSDERRNLNVRQALRHRDNVIGLDDIRSDDSRIELIALCSIVLVK